MLHTSLKFLLVGFIGTGLLISVHGCDESPNTDEMSQTRGGNEVSGLMTLTDLGQEMERRMDMMLRELLSPDQQVSTGMSDMMTPDASPLQCSDDQDCDDGIFCNGRERCSAGRCYASPTRPCNDGISCTVDVCNEEMDACTNERRDDECPEKHVCDRKLGCLPIVPCEADADCNDGSACNGVEVCRDNRCLTGEPIECDDEIECTEDVCVDRPDGTGTCEYLPVHIRCVETELCSVNDGCGQRPPCQRDDDCDDGSFCNGTETCDLETETCIPGEAPNVDDGVACTIDVCSDRMAMVLHTPTPARCSDGLFCNGAEVCDPRLGCQAGQAPSLSDGVGCTRDTCDEEVDIIRHVPDDSICNDQLFCNGAEVCDIESDCQPGEPPTVNDNLDCTIDSCNEVDDRIEHVPSNQVCDDGLFCNGVEVCDVVEGCKAGVAPIVADAFDCTVDRCDEANDRIEHIADNARCDDGLFCNGAERCDADQGCINGRPPALDDGFACTDDQCDEETNTIVHLPRNEACDDGRFCNGDEVCDANQGCRAGVPPILTDNVECTLDICNEMTDTVEHRPNHADCDDARRCNGNEMCVLGVGCQPGEPLNCDDGLFCSGQETCDDQLGCLPGTPPVISDGIACTADRCDEDADRVVHTPVDANCDDNQFCTGVEICDPDSGCLEGTPPNLDDGIDCTDDRCNEATDQVEHLPNDANCDNDIYCDGVETCSPDRGCQDGAPPDTDDGVACTEDACDEGTRQIVHTPRNDWCQDRNVCDGTEVCDVQRDCLNGEPPADGTVCEPNPRGICLNRKCVNSACGDGFVDVDAGEQCEDGNRVNGDGCSSVCRNEADPGGGVDPTGYTGCYEIQPPVLHECRSLFSGELAVRIEATRFDFTRLVNELLVRRGAPAPGAVPAPANMTQRPPPDDGNFVVEGINDGLCVEEYRLSGRFTNAERTRWTAELRICFGGIFCGLTDCAEGCLPAIELQGSAVACE